MNGRAYAEHQAPLHEVGALLEAKAVHNGRSARNHLLVLASTCGISARRVDELLDRVFVGVLLVLPVVASALPQTWGDRINKWLPSNAGPHVRGIRQHHVFALARVHRLLRLRNRGTRGCRSAVASSRRMSAVVGDPPLQRRRIPRRTKLDFWLDFSLLVAFALDYSFQFTEIGRAHV